MEVLIKLSDAIKTLKSMAVPLVRKLPSEQPERLTDYSFEESCTECPAYDTENHRCPRFNQVIRTALKDANLEPCKNCISRQAAIDAIEEYADRLQMVDWKENPGVPYKAYALNWCINTIRDLPSAQPERKKGTWINEGRIIRCNKCKIGYATVKGMKSALTYNFCPNCGADMRGEQDEMEI